MAKVKPRVPEGGAILDGEENEFPAEKYSAIMRRVQGPGYREFVKHLLGLEIPVGARVLEIGPGPSWITVWFANARPDLQITAVEASPDMIRVASQTALLEGVGPQIQFVQGTVERLEEFVQGPFDLVYSNDSLHHWEDPLAALRSIDSVLSPTGRVFIRDGRRDLGFGAKVIVNVFGPLFSGSMCKYWKSSLAAAYTPEELREMVSKSTDKRWQVVPTILDLTIES
jgi:ubiquinone/menaquinone biosynthesis C-methylase UbiE